MSTIFHVIIGAESRLELNIKNDDEKISDMMLKVQTQSNKQRESYEFLNIETST